MFWGIWNILCWVIVFFSNYKNVKVSMFVKINKNIEGVLLSVIGFIFYNCFFGSF